MGMFVHSRRAAQGSILDFFCKYIFSDLISLHPNWIGLDLIFGSKVTMTYLFWFDITW